MLIDSNEMRLRLSPDTQRLLGEVLAVFKDKISLQFGDEQAYYEIMGEHFQLDGNACYLPGNERPIIFIRQLKPVTRGTELDIAHELGHLWLESFEFPRFGFCRTKEERKTFKTYRFAWLMEIMEHAIYYPKFKGEYGIDLYNIGNKRLEEFLDRYLGRQASNSGREQIGLILYFIKYHVEANDGNLVNRLDAVYSERFVKIREKAEEALRIIQGLVGQEPDATNFKDKYHDVLRSLGVSEQHWPGFLHSHEDGHSRNP